MKRATIFAVLGFIVLTQYVNCSTYSNSIYDGGSVKVSDDGSGDPFLRITSADVTMACYEDHVQLGGPCNPGDAKDNYIQYWLTRDRQPVYWGTSPPIDHLTLAKCENGRFYAIVPKPTDPVGLGSTGAGFVEYQLNMQMYTPEEGKPGYQAGVIGPAFTFSVQKNANCGG